MYVNREEFIQELILREHIRNVATKRINQKKKNATQNILEEKVLRNMIRKLIKETAEEAAPHRNTGINVLADLLEKIIPIVEDDFKMLTTSEEQRSSFRNHIIKAIKNTLKPLETVDDAEDAAKLGENTIFEIDRSVLLEKVKIDLDPDGDDPASAVAGEFIDIEAPEETDQFVQIDDQNETGRNFAATTFKQIEKQIVDAYDMLADEEDQKMFYDYLLTNMLLYFDKFEDELASKVPDSTTPEYEEEKEKTASEESTTTTDSDSGAAEEDSAPEDNAEDVDDIFAGI